MYKIAILMVLCVTTMYCITFDIELQNYSRTCFKQFISIGSAFRFEVKAEQSGNFQFSLFLKDGLILMKNPKDEMVKKIDSFSATSQTYNFCVENLSKKQIFSITYLTGIELSDIRFFPKEDDSKEINKLVDSLNSVYNQIRKREEYSMTVNQYNMELQKLVSFKSVGFGFLSITVVLIISFLHYLEIKRVLKNRKII